MLRAARLLADRAGITAGAALHLDKHLPVAAGIGGGSSDAAAALLALKRLWRISLEDEALCALGARLGADIPACLYRRAVWVGESANASSRPGRCRSRHSAGQSAQSAADRRGIRRPAWPVRPCRTVRADAGTASALARALMPCRNDLTEAAIGLVPEIAAVLARLGRLPGSLLARMSGSGATCFALFADRAGAEEARAVVAAAEPRWWCAAGGFVSGASLAD